VWISGDLFQRLRRRGEQDVVDDGLVLERDGRDLVWHREHDMEVRYVEKFRLAIRDPLGASESLALRTVPVPARVVGYAAMTAAVALLDMAAQNRRATAFDRVHRAPARSGQRSAGAVAESRAEPADRVRQFRSLAGHRTVSSGGCDCRRGEMQRFQRADRGA